MQEEKKTPSSSVAQQHSGQFVRKRLPWVAKHEASIDAWARPTPLSNAELSTALAPSCLAKRQSLAPLRSPPTTETLITKAAQPSSCKSSWRFRCRYTSKHETCQPGSQGGGSGVHQRKVRLLAANSSSSWCAIVCARWLFFAFLAAPSFLRVLFCFCVVLDETVGIWLLHEQ